MKTYNIPLPAGREGLEPTKVVVHAIAEFVIKDGRVYYATEWLRKKGLSYHVLVTPSGTPIRCRNDNQVAWHAKAQGHNFKALGIGFMVPGAYDYISFLERIKTSYLTGSQFDGGVKFCREEWVDKGILHFAKHSSIDDAKQDPGDGFLWKEFLTGIGVIGG